MLMLSLLDALMLMLLLMFVFVFCVFVVLYVEFLSVSNVLCYDVDLKCVLIVFS